MQLQIPSSLAALYGSLGPQPAAAAPGSKFMHMTLVIDIISWLAARARNENEMRIKVMVGGAQEEALDGQSPIVRNVHADSDKCASPSECREEDRDRMIIAPPPRLLACSPLRRAFVKFST